MPTCQAQGASNGNENTDLARKEIDMNYYIQGDAAKADKIKAAFERLGYDITYPDGCANPAALNIGVELIKKGGQDGK